MVAPSSERPALPFTAPWLLAPMEGVTDPSFRDLVMDRHRKEDLGGGFTEFARVSVAPLPRRILSAHLGDRRHAMPVGLQLMGNHEDHLATTACRAVDVGAPLIDLNFGCPARGANRTCAGSALLDDPPRIERIVARLRSALPKDTPLSAKIRAGVRDDRRLEDVARAVQAGGADLLTVHCRTREEGYREEALDWSRIRRVVDAVPGLPVCGNGGVSRHADFERMRRETGCDFVMVGRAAIGNPWIFRERAASDMEAIEFLEDYARVMWARCAPRAHHAAARLKQMIKHWTAARLFADDRATWLTEADADRLLDRLMALGRQMRHLKDSGRAAG
ncbi:MAG: tRNA-dihydrouridine synthase family protein [Planctomycetes bacterium]|nr:tRNA-dihydrouridine synthase family protein [Planctomycetota bacterium]